MPDPDDMIRPWSVVGTPEPRRLGCGQVGPVGLAPQGAPGLLGLRGGHEDPGQIVPAAVAGAAEYKVLGSASGSGPNGHPACTRGTRSRRHVLLQPGPEPGQVISDGREPADAVSFPGADHQF